MLCSSKNHFKLQPKSFCWVWAKHFLWEIYSSTMAALDSRRSSLTNDIVLESSPILCCSCSKGLEKAQPGPRSLWGGGGGSSKAMPVRRRDGSFSSDFKQCDSYNLILQLTRTKSSLGCPANCESGRIGYQQKEEKGLIWKLNVEHHHGQFLVL